MSRRGEETELIMYRLLSLILPGILILSACGGDSEEINDSGSPAAVATTAATQAATQAVTQAAQAATAAATQAATAAVTAVATPEGDISEYTVIAGDNLTTIAARYGLTVDQLRSLNPEISGDVLWVGQILKVAGDPKPLGEATVQAASPEPTASATTVATAVATAAAAATAASAQSSSGQPPFVPYGTNALAYSTITVSVNGSICDTTTADDKGQWFIRVEDSCASSGMTVEFSSDDGRKASAEYVVGAGVEIFLDR